MDTDKNNKKKDPKEVTLNTLNALNETTTGATRHVEDKKTITITHSGKGHIMINETTIDKYLTEIKYLKKLLNTTETFAKQQIEDYKNLLEVKDEQIDTLKDTIKHLSDVVDELSKSSENNK